MGRLEDVDIEELEKLISETPESIEIADPDSNVLKYTKGVGIEQGRQPVANFVIYHHYYNKFEPGGKKLSYVEFFRQFNKLFDQRRTGTTRYYMLRGGIFNLDKESIDVARQFRKKITKK